MARIQQVPLLVCLWLAVVTTAAAEPASVRSTLIGDERAMPTPVAHSSVSDLTPADLHGRQLFTARITTLDGVEPPLAPPQPAAPQHPTGLHRSNEKQEQ